MRKHLLKTTVLATFFCVGLFPPAHAEVPVIDPAVLTQLEAISQQLGTDFGIQTEQLQTIIAELQTAAETLITAQQQLEALTGDKGIEALFKAAGIDTFNEGAFASLADLYEAVSTGDFSKLADTTLPDGSTGQEIAEDLLATVGLSETEVQTLAKSDAYNDNAAATQAGSGVGLSVQAQHSYQVAGKHTEALKVISEQIDKTEDTKASTDLGTLATIQLGYAIAELIRVEAASATAQAQAMISQAGGTADAAKYSNFTTEE